MPNPIAWFPVEYKRLARVDSNRRCKNTVELFFIEGGGNSLVHKSFP